MCLGVPMKVIKIDKNRADVELGGVKRTIGLDLLEKAPVPGEYVIVHAGFAISVIDEKEAEITLGYLRELDEL